MPDFTNYQTLASVRALAEDGRLVKLLLFPAEFGGADEPRNTVYVTHEAAAAHATIVATIRRMAGEGQIDQLEVKPEWRGNSFVPASIRFSGSHSAKSGNFAPEIVVW